jgi:hypothetical protein
MALGVASGFSRRYRETRGDVGDFHSDVSRNGQIVTR